MKNSLLYVSSSFPGIQALSCNNEFSFGEHIHNGHVLWTNANGAERYTLGKKKSVLPQGSFSVIEPGVVHANSPYETGGRHLRSLYLQKEFFQHLEKLFTGSDAGKMTLGTAVFDNCSSWNQLILFHEAVISGEDRMAVEQYVVSLFSSIYRDSAEKIPGHNHYGGGDKRIDKIIEYMNSNLAEQVSLGDLSELLDCTSYHLIRVFKAAKGMSPHAYLVQLRLEAARQYLDQGMPIIDVASATGFADQSHLTRKFKQRYGLTPGGYISQIIT